MGVRRAVDEWLAQHNWTHAAEEARAFGYFKSGRHLKKRNYVFKANPFSEQKPFRIWSSAPRPPRAARVLPARPQYSTSVPSPRPKLSQR